MHAKINIQMDSAASQAKAANKLAVVLSRLSRRLEMGLLPDCEIKDLNGKKVGTFAIHQDSDPVLTALRAMTPIFVLLTEGTKNILHLHAIELAREAIKQAEL